MLLADLKQKISSALALDQAIFSYPSNSKLGDISLAGFDLAKSRKTSPSLVAQELATKLKDKKELNLYFSNIQALGPYLNFFIRPEYLAKELIKNIKTQKNNYGQNKSGAGERVMIEYSNGNTHKEYHVGHLRNISYGDAINNLLRANAYESIPVSYINDFGIHVAKTIWNWQRDPAYQKSSEPKGYLLGNCYAQANEILENNIQGKQEVVKIMKEIESRQGENYKFWQVSRQWSIDYFQLIYKELNIKFAHIFYESEVVAAGLKIVKNLLAQGILVKSQGAIIANLEKYDLGILPIIRTDGTALYAVADLALASEKFTNYNLTKSIYVVDVRQSLYFKQLFKILELAGYTKPMIHLTYDFVTLPEGMMSSRSGNVITYQALKTKLFARFLAETKKRHVDWSKNKIREVASDLTLSSIKFEMLKVKADKIITFNIEEATKFEGYTACYIQYSYARLQSIIRKSLGSFWLGRLNLKYLSTELEKELLLKLAKYPEVIKESLEKYNPSELTKYLFELAQLFNDYYHKVNILKSKSNYKQARLALIKAISQVLANGLKILGIKVLEKM